MSSLTQLNIRHFKCNDIIGTYAYIQLRVQLRDIFSNDYVWAI